MLMPLAVGRSSCPILPGPFVVGKKELCTNLFVQVVVVGLCSLLHEAIAVPRVIAASQQTQDHHITHGAVGFLHDLVGFERQHVAPATCLQTSQEHRVNKSVGVCRAASKGSRLNLQSLPGQPELWHIAAAGTVGGIDRLEGHRLHIPPPYGPPIRSWQIAGYWIFCDSVIEWPITNQIGYKIMPITNQISYSLKYLVK